MGKHLAAKKVLRLAEQRVERKVDLRADCWVAYLVDQ